METIVKNYFDNETLEHVGTRYFVDKEEVNFQEYAEMIEELVSDEEETQDDCVCSQDENCEGYNCSECPGCDNVECCEENRDNDCEDKNVCSVCGEVDCDCGECMCDDCCSQRHDDIVNASVGKAFNKIMESDGCPNCVIDTLMEMSLEMKRLGWSDHRDYINQCNC